MARKEDIICRLNVLASILGRDIDTSGTVADLEQLLRETEDEAAMLADDPGTSDEDLAGGEGVQDSATRADGAVVGIRVTKTLHVRGANGKRESARIVRLGRETTVRADDFATFKPGLAVRVT